MANLRDGHAHFIDIPNGDEIIDTLYHTVVVDLEVLNIVPLAIVLRRTNLTMLRNSFESMGFFDSDSEPMSPRSV